MGMPRRCRPTRLSESRPAARRIDDSRCFPACHRPIPRRRIAAATASTPPISPPRRSWRSTSLRTTAAMDWRGLYLVRAVADAIDLSARHQLLDVAGGSGIYACCLVERNPHVRATVLEKPPVDAVAARAIASRGFGDRVSVHASDML